MQHDSHTSDHPGNDFGLRGIQLDVLAKFLADLSRLGKATRRADIPRYKIDRIYDWELYQNVSIIIS